MHYKRNVDIIAGNGNNDCIVISWDPICLKPVVPAESSGKDVDWPERISLMNWVLSQILW